MKSVVFLYRYQNVLSLLSCFAGGVFLGTCIMDLLPDVQIQIADLLSHYPQWNNKFPFAEFIILFGFLFVLTLEQIILYFKESDEIRWVNQFIYLMMSILLWSF